MKYDWEDEALASFAEMGEYLPPHLYIVGLAIENVETGEGALVSLDTLPEATIIDADVWKDILGDANEKYTGVKESMFAIFDKKQKDVH
jgi:hypothetical protein